MESRSAIGNVAGYDMLVSHGGRSGDVIALLVLFAGGSWPDGGCCRSARDA